MLEHKVAVGLFSASNSVHVAKHLHQDLSGERGTKILEAYDSHLKCLRHTCPASGLSSLVKAVWGSVAVEGQPAQARRAGSARPAFGGQQRHRAVLMIVDGLTHELDPADYIAALKLQEGDQPEPDLYVLQIRDNDLPMEKTRKLWETLFSRCAHLPLYLCLRSER